MSTNNFVVNSDSINASGNTLATALKLNVTSVNIKLAADSSGFLARRFLVPNIGSYIKYNGNVLTAAKKPIFANSNINSVFNLPNLCRRVSLGVMNEINSIGDIGAFSGLCRTFHLSINASIINIGDSCGIANKQHTTPNPFITNINCTSFLKKKQTLRGNVSVKNEVSSSLINNGSVGGSSLVRLTISPVMLVVSGKFNLPIISLTAGCYLYKKQSVNLNIAELGVNLSSGFTKKKAIEASANLNSLFASSVIISKGILSSTSDITITVSSTLINTKALYGEVTLQAAVNSVKFINSPKFNPPIINILSACNLHNKQSIAPSPVIVNVGISRNIYAILYDKAPIERTFIIEEDYRYIVIPEEIKIMNVFKKQPADSYDYDFTYDEWLMNQDSVESVVVTTFPNDASDADGLQVEIRNLLSPYLKLWISGGKNGVTYKITITATTVENRIKQSEFKLKIKDI